MSAIVREEKAKEKRAVLRHAKGQKRPSTEVQET
jgi:hypothetical protein